LSTKFSDGLKALRPLCAGAVLFSLIFGQLALRLQYGPGGLLQNADSAKFVSLCLEEGAAHSPCYPLYLMLSKGFFSLGFVFDPGARCSLFSALLCSLALVFLWDLLRRKAGGLFFPFLPFSRPSESGKTSALFQVPATGIKMR